MNRLMHFSFALVLALSSPTWAEDLFKATYTGEYANLNITMVRTLSSTNNGYLLSSNASSFMARIDETSEFKQQGSTFQPIRYAYARKIFGVTKQEHLTFDWQKNIATFTKGKKKQSEQKILAKILDPTLYQLQLQFDLVQNPNKPLYSYSFVRRDQTKTYHLKQEGTSELTLDGKKYPVKIFARTEEKDSKTLIWLIPALDYAIGKIERTEEDGSSYQVLLTHYESRPSLKGFLAKKVP